MWRPECATAFLRLRDALVRAPILAFPTESGDYVLDTDASNFGLVEYLARSRMTRNGSLLTAVVLSGLLSVDTALPNERPFPCVYSFVLTYAALDSLFGQTTSLLSGFTGLKILRG